MRLKQPPCARRNSSAGTCARARPTIEPLPELPIIEETEALFPKKEPPPKPHLIEVPEPFDEEQVAQEDKAPPAFEAPPDEVAAALMDGAMPLTPSQAPTTWQSVLLGQIEHHKRDSPEALRNRQEPVVYVRITINRNGSMVDYRLT
ncbi:MAG: TonB C-terminal domain-containing protein [Pseudomonadales bacterium]|nr:TonB C-terminal domain-containing protein [Pseudomonadales bacterium]